MRNSNLKKIIPAIIVITPGFIYWLFLGWYSFTSTIIILFGDRTEAKVESIFIDRGVYWGDIRYQVTIDGNTRLCFRKIPLGPESMQLKEGKKIEIALKYNSCDRAVSPKANRIPFLYALIFIFLLWSTLYVGKYILRHDSEKTDKLK